MSLSCIQEVAYGPRMRLAFGQVNLHRCGSIAMPLIVVTMLSGAGCSSSKGSPANGGAGGGKAGMAGSAGSGATGGAAGAGGTAGTTGGNHPGGASGATGGASGNGGVMTVDPLLEWAQWPMPNDWVDVGGDDGGVGASNLESYTDNGDGTVTDNVTGLMWQQAEVTRGFTFSLSGEEKYCSSLTLGGHADWHLPTVIELVSLLDYSASNGINATVFPNVGNFVYSSTLHSSYQMLVHFNSGNVDTDDMTSKGDVMCVRSAASAAAPVEHYLVNGTGGTATVRDVNTGLTWQQLPASTAMTFAAARSTCAGLGGTLGGAGWRLPTEKELLTLVDFAQTAPPFIDSTAFPGTPPSEYSWASTWSSNSGTYGWVVDFNDAIGLTSALSNAATVRCVRDGESGVGGVDGGVDGSGAGGTGATGDKDNYSWAQWPMPNDSVDVAGGAPNPASYTDNGDGTVTDNVTGLIWQQTPSATTYVWADAVEHCPTIALAGQRDWRLPELIELQSLLDYGPSTAPMIDASVFPETPTDTAFWTATPFASIPAVNWVVSFLDADLETGGSNYVRCVRNEVK
jgi:hypothetical protein